MIDHAELANLWGGSPPRVVRGRCLNVRHRARDCRICVEACPVSAISIPHQAGGNAEPIVLDQDACVRCGLCPNVCPTGVFAQTEPPESRLLQAIARSSSQVIELACPRKEPPDLSRVPEADVVQTPRCLAALSVPTLLDLAARGKTLWLNDSMCHTCSIGGARQAIEQTVIVAGRWLQVMGREPAIRSYLGAADELVEVPTSRPVIRGGRSVLSRRDFFKSLTSRTAQATGGFIADRQGPRPGEAESARPEGPHADRGDTEERTGHRLAHHIPAPRQHLASALRRLASDPMAQLSAAGLPVADVTVSDSCTACGLCAQFCPTEAITFLSDDEYYVLHFSAALCLGEDCSLCIIGCPVDAVRFGRELIVDELLSTQPRPLKAGRLTPCPQCGALTHAPALQGEDEPEEIPLCYICQARANRPDLLSSLPTVNDREDP
jgi:NAD-dependent dihydropyrimidine dehydrogenase PreA subunit